MSTKKRPQVTYTERVPWQPTQLKLTAGMCGATDKLFVYHDWDAGGDWWTNGCVLFRGSAPSALRQAFVYAGRPVGVTIKTLPMGLALVRAAPTWTVLDLPCDSYQVKRATQHRPVPIDVFPADNDRPEIHVDARYVAHALSCYQGCTFWRVNDDMVAVSEPYDARELVGVIRHQGPPSRLARTRRARRAS